MFIGLAFMLLASLGRSARMKVRLEIVPFLVKFSLIPLEEWGLWSDPTSL
jgi:hypothetical protein